MPFGFGVWHLSESFTVGTLKLYIPGHLAIARLQIKSSGMLSLKASHFAQWQERDKELRDWSSANLRPKTELQHLLGHSELEST
jgi:hypothetical protein